MNSQKGFFTAELAESAEKNSFILSFSLGVLGVLRGKSDFLRMHHFSAFSAPW
jgi:hypothetical protein